MAVYDYAEVFADQLAQKYSREMVSHDLTLSNQGIKFLNAQTIKIPRLTVSGYKDHNRGSMGFNTGKCNYQDKVKTILTAEKKLIEVTGTALFAGDIAPTLPVISGGKEKSLRP